ncbi:hypothetical protein FQR65_LT17066 [Abscondita terminalis]|nr:hypothetical protein FQR65_LT17066 [Abscondita terminalis]
MLVLSQDHITKPQQSHLRLSAALKESPKSYTAYEIRLPDKWYVKAIGAQQYNKTLVERVETSNYKDNMDERVFFERWQKPGDNVPLKGDYEYYSLPTNLQLSFRMKTRLSCKILILTVKQFCQEPHGCKKIRFEIINIFIADVAEPLYLQPYFRERGSARRRSALLKPFDPIIKYSSHRSSADQIRGFLSGRLTIFSPTRSLRMNYYAVKALQARAHLWYGEKDLAFAAASEVIEAKDSNGTQKFKLGTSADFTAKNFVLTDTLKLQGLGIAIFPEMHREADGIIGNSLVKRFITKVDYNKCELLLYDFGDYQDEQQGHAIPLKCLQDMLIIPAESGNPPGKGKIHIPEIFVFDNSSNLFIDMLQTFLRNNDCWFSDLNRSTREPQRRMGVIRSLCKSISTMVLNGSSWWKYLRHADSSETVLLSNSTPEYQGLYAIGGSDALSLRHIFKFYFKGNDELTSLRKKQIIAFPETILLNIALTEVLRHSYRYWINPSIGPQ